MCDLHLLRVDADLRMQSKPINPPTTPIFFSLLNLLNTLNASNAFLKIKFHRSNKLESSSLACVLLITENSNRLTSHDLN